jgi:transcriptional regulator
MYIPRPNVVGDETVIRDMVAASASAQFVTTGPDGYPVATLLPIIWIGDTVIAHMAKANPQWRNIDGHNPVLLICSGPQAYISPSWYAAKAEHGRVVPTWNYSAVHLTGTVRVHEDPQWLRGAVEELTAVHESPRRQPWQVADAPADYISGQLGGIVGLEISVNRVEAKAKLSQNRSQDDQRGVIAGLQSENQPGADAIACEMSRLPGLNS